MRRVDLTPALRVPTLEMSVLQDRAVLRGIGADRTEVMGPDWPVMEAFGALLFLLNQSRAPGQRTLKPGMGELGFSIDRHSGLLPPGMVALRCICGLYPPPDMFAVLNILRNVSNRPDEASHFAGEPN